ncbi:MAG: ATP-dependent sacrificial sulfur transferase LarE [Clostridia bacterium]|nr:ATP-dependent sacrificial sulfur transferase LarE [Clostridia bacterium]
MAVAFSGGVDSTLLLTAAVEALGADRVLAVTAASLFFPLREKDESVAFCEQLGVRQVVVQKDVMAIPGVPENGPDRCYHCKQALFKDLQRIAAENGFTTVCEGSNMDDNGDYRPGLIAIAELGVKSPLRHVGLYKSEIRDLSRELGLPTWKKPAFACLASRVPYGQRITNERLDRIGKAEQKLVDLGFGNIRVRDHNDGEIARIEFEGEDIRRVTEPAIAAEVDEYFKQLGYTYVAVELTGYRTGNLNRQIAEEDRETERKRQESFARGADGPIE